MPSGMQVEFDLDASDFEAEIEAIQRKWPRHAEAMLLAIAEHFVGEAKQEIPRNTGTAQKTIRVRESDRKSAVVVAGGQDGVNYILPLLEGSRPHPPGSSDPAKNRSLARWADRNNYPGGFQGIYWTIAKYGTEAHDFVSGPRRDTERKSGGLATRVLKNRGVLE